jgi:SAM-dependent methyltransferase
MIPGDDAIDRQASVFDAHVPHFRRKVASSIAFACRPHEYFTGRKTEYLIDLTRRFVGDPAGLVLLDVGCGVGVSHSLLIPRYREVHGVDVAASAVERAAFDNRGGRYTSYAGDTLPFADSSFDVVFAACVLHHVDRPERAAFVREMRRVVRPGGIGVLFEHNPFNPLTRLAVRRCEFDDDVHLLTRSGARRLVDDSAGTPIESAYIIAHTSSRKTLLALERRVAAVPFGSQYYVAFR